MSPGGEETKAQELVIIRRPISSEEGGHKGGVWKIAYADFMTAMMAFFLVMWLINASDKQTLTQVATYFNPLRLTDKVALSKGLHQTEAIAQGNDKSPGNPLPQAGPAKGGSDKSSGNEKSPAGSKQQVGTGKGESKNKVEGAKPKYTEEVLFRDPYAVLSKLAEEQASATNRGEAYRDPFDPAFRREGQADKRESAKGTAASPATAPEPAGPAASAVRGEAKHNNKAITAPSGTAPEPVGQPTVSVPGEAKQGANIEAPAPPAPHKQTEEKAREQTTERAGVAERAADAERAAERAAAVERTAAKLEGDIKQALARAIAGALPTISVTVTDEGILISLTDDQNFGMFAIASAEPRPAMVVLMEKLGKIIATFTEPLVVRGHTDARPYKSGTYDNWRLSTARAHMAYYMLVRAGIEEKRFERIEGHADRNLRIVDDPEAAQNRRIEILLRKGRP